MFWLIACGVTILSFGFVLLVGAPYVPTLKSQQNRALDFLNLKPGQMLLELGCGDGRVLNAAASRGIRSVGYELNPVLFIIAKVLTWKNRRLVSVKYGNFWNKNWPEADGIYVFLLAKYMKKLDKKITQTYCGKNVKLVSYAFVVPGKKYSKAKDALYLYRY
jgi:SAM-dependent methyltransferase